MCIRDSPCRRRSKTPLTHGNGALAMALGGRMDAAPPEAAKPPPLPAHGTHSPNILALPTLTIAKRAR
eukprot:10408132-Prorocentrum_lima.AAC.1